MLSEVATSCPFCGEMIDLFIDTSAGSQSYIEDCSVCCQPMQIAFETYGDAVEHVLVERAD
ncbi:MAG: CPXCG motif-containing cysteine-rich protein [Pseudomonadota bacterium]